MKNRAKSDKHQQQDLSYDPTARNFDHTDVSGQPDKINEVPDRKTSEKKQAAGNKRRQAPGNKRA